MIVCVVCSTTPLGGRMLPTTMRLSRTGMPMFLDQSGLFLFGNRVLQLRSGGRIGRQLKEGIPLNFFAYECAIWAVHPRLPI
jgi:hypothetical protein